MPAPPQNADGLGNRCAVCGRKPALLSVTLQCDDRRQARLWFCSPECCLIAGLRHPGGLPAVSDLLRIFPEGDVEELH